MANFPETKLLVAVCGSIAAYKSCYLVRDLRKAGADVTVAMTRSAMNFVGPASFAALTGNPVQTEMFPKAPPSGVYHVDIAEQFDAFIVAPATANMLGKAAHAVADDLISTLLNIVDCPVIFFPAMNHRMWANPATVEAVEKLRAWGRTVIDPDEGTLATLHEGRGRLPELDRMLVEIAKILDIDGPLNGRKVVVTAGPTREPIDPVRFLSNRSSGKMGYALAQAAARMGAQVTLISGPVDLPVPRGVEGQTVETATEMLAAVHAAKQAGDILIMAAAVADFQAAQTATEKIRRKQAPDRIDLQPTLDIIKEVRLQYETIVAFNLQKGDDPAIAKKKLDDKDADIIVSNRYDKAGAGFDSDTNTVKILARSGAEVEVSERPKLEIAQEILRFVLENPIA